VQQQRIPWSFKPSIQIDVSMKPRTRKKINFDDLQLRYIKQLHNFSTAHFAFQFSMIFLHFAVFNWVFMVLVFSAFFCISTIHFQFCTEICGFAKHIDVALGNYGPWTSDINSLTFSFPLSALPNAHIIAMLHLKLDLMLKIKNPKKSESFNLRLLFIALDFESLKFIW
jgi:hypothetical protein